MAEVFRPAEKPDATFETHVVRLKANEVRQVVIFSPAVWPVMTHWNPGRGPKGRSEACYVPNEECPGCRMQLARKWRGYLFVGDLFGSRPDRYFMELTTGMDDWLQRYCPLGETLRGKTIRVQRMNGEAARLKIEPITVSVTLANLPADQDPVELLSKMWGMRLPSARGRAAADVVPFKHIG